MLGPGGGRVTNGSKSVCLGACHGLEFLDSEVSGQDSGDMGGSWIWPVPLAWVTGSCKVHYWDSRSHGRGPGIAPISHVWLAAVPVSHEVVCEDGRSHGRDQGPARPCVYRWLEFPDSVKSSVGGCGSHGRGGVRVYIVTWNHATPSPRCPCPQPCSVSLF